MKLILKSRLFIAAIILTSIFNFSCSTSKQVSSQSTPLQLAQAINDDQWIFTPTQALPNYGRTKALNGTDIVKLNNHELTVSLPYFGRLTSGSGVFAGNPLDFTSSNYRLSKDNSDNTKWTVMIESPNPEVRSMLFTFYDNGTAQLTVGMTNRTGINFTGTLSPVK